MGKIDRKYKILAVNIISGTIHTEADSVIMCAQDKAVPVALRAYRDECVRIGASSEHIQSVECLIDRVTNFQAATGGGKIPDTMGGEIPLCLYEEDVDH